jgi:predicted RNA-binding protein (virulence factor B family)
MSNVIGDAAGKIWQYLNDNGPSSANKIEKDTGISKNDIQRAIGWLSKEDKLIIEAKGRVETILLK